MRFLRVIIRATNVFLVGLKVMASRFRGRASLIRAPDRYRKLARARVWGSGSSLMVRTIISIVGGSAIGLTLMRGGLRFRVGWLVVSDGVG